jgi:histidine triad (HIT) family protein
MENCIFDKIINGEIPSTKVYEDENFLAFLDIEPVSDGHLLLIPKKHIVWMQDADDKTISDIFILAKKLMLAIKKGIGCDYVQLSIVGKDVPHLHIHLIPRYFKDILPMFPIKEYKEKESIEAAQKIIGALARP